MYVERLAALVAKTQKKADTLQAGRVSGDYVIVNGRAYRPTWGGDFDVAHGDRADCIIDGEKCVVVRCSR